jgi:uncharacterized membrane protein YkgB
MIITLLIIIIIMIIEPRLFVLALLGIWYLAVGAFVIAGLALMHVALGGSLPGF